MSQHKNIKILDYNESRDNGVAVGSLVIFGKLLQTHNHVSILFFTQWMLFPTSKQQYKSSTEGNTFVRIITINPVALIVSGGLLAWLYVRSEVQTCIWLS